jgi:hypothetical protein
LKRPTVNKSDQYFGKIIKYIPTEVVAGYVAASGFVKVLHPPHSQFTWFCIISIGLLVLTPLYFLMSTSASINSYRHAVAGTIAFAAWVFATGGPFQASCGDKLDCWYSPAIGSIVLIFVCLSLPFLERLVPDRAEHVVGPDRR